MIAVAGSRVRRLAECRAAVIKQIWKLIFPALNRSNRQAKAGVTVPLPVGMSPISLHKISAVTRAWFTGISNVSQVLKRMGSVMQRNVALNTTVEARLEDQK